MEDQKIIFTLDNNNTLFYNSNGKKKNDENQKLANIIHKNINNLMFLYKGKKIDYDLNVNELSNNIDKEMKILVTNVEDDFLICPKCGEKIKFNKEKIYELILCNNKTNNIINEIILQIEKIKNSQFISMNKILNNYNKTLKTINISFLRNTEKFINLFKDKKYLNVNNKFIITSNYYNNKNIIKNELDYKLNEINDKVNQLNININKEISDKLKYTNLYNKIKSKYIFKIIFSYLNELIKLKVIKYNKKLQSKIGVGLIYYKHFSGSYIIYETNKKGKQYNIVDNRLLFEGEYLNGERNGNGKDYFDNGKLYYEGEYSKGKMEGKGKEYYEDGGLRFEGEYKNGNEWNGKGYDKSNNIVYELKYGKGFIKEYYNIGKLYFEGEYMNGQKNGKGKEYYYDGELRFEGEFKDGKKWNGKGYDENKNIIYELNNGQGKVKYYGSNSEIEFEGEYVNGEKNGKGKEYNSGELDFEGEYLNGERNGIGKEYENGKIISEGEYLNGEKNGKIKEYNNNGTLSFEGYYLYDYKLRGKEYIKGKLEYEGEYLCDKKWEGKGYDKYGNIIYELINGNGKVKEYNDEGILIFEGEYLNGEKNGKGIEYEDGKYIFYGEYLNGKHWNGLIIVFGEKDERICIFEYINGFRFQKYCVRFRK